MKLSILGCHSATPRIGANPTAQVLETRGHVFLIDCGEGTQIQLRRSKVKFSRIRHVFISHLHGDHFFGLIGLISSFRLLGREAELHIYGPSGIKELITLQLKLGNSWTNYPLYFHELSAKEGQVVFEDDKIKVETVPLNHRVYTNGFVFKEKPGARKLDYQAALKAGIDKSYFNKLKQGKDVSNDRGERIDHRQVTSDPEPTRSYAFCSDTVYHPPLAEHIQGVTALYHESTFLESHRHLCEKTKHSTALEAARIAKMAGVETLILGHYSGRYKNLEMFRTEASKIFPNVRLARDGKVFEI